MWIISRLLPLKMLNRMNLYCVCHSMCKVFVMQMSLFHRAPTKRMPMKLVIDYINGISISNFNCIILWLIVIGGWGNTRTLIRKNNQVLAKVKEYNILSDTRPVKVILEITKAGKISVFTDHNKSKPFLEVDDSSPITDINYISFSGYYRDLDYYYDCAE